MSRSKTIPVKSFKPRSIIEDLCKVFDVEYDSENHQTCVNIPKKMGNGYIKAYDLDLGVSTFEIDCMFNEEIEFAIGKCEIHLLKMMYCLDGLFYHKFEKDNDYTEIKRLENIITSDSPFNPHRFKIPANTPFCAVVIDINRKLFEEKIESFINEMPNELMILFRDLNGINTFYYKNFYSLEIAKCIDNLKECGHADFLNKVYVEGKIYEILSESLRQYVDDQNESDKQNIIRQVTKERVQKATQIIEDEIDQMDNISDLAKRVGLNQNTLQKAFKSIYKTSVNEYIRRHRIEKAKELIEKTDNNITQISYRIGINSRSYFSKLFKDYYGISPKKYADQYRAQSA